MKNIIKWYDNLVKFHNSTYKKVPLSNCKNWKINENKISHNSKLFFEIIGLEISCRNKKNKRKNWTQPILKEKNYKGGILGFLKKKIRDKDFFLIQGKFEPGNIYGVQLSPTVQSTFSSISFNKGKIRYLDFFLNKKYRKNINLKKWVSEDGGRFYKKKNLVMIVDVSNYNLKINQNYIWIDKLTMKKLNYYKDPIVNPHVRTLLSFLT